MKLSAMWCSSNWRKHLFKLEKTETMSPFTKNILTQIIQSIKTEVKCYITLQLHHTYIITTTCLVLCWSPFCLDFTRPPRCAVVSGTKTFATDPLSPLWRLVHPTDARFDWDRGNLEASLKLAVVVLKPLMNHFGFVAGHIIILKETPAVREYCFHERVCMFCNNT